MRIPTVDELIAGTSIQPRPYQHKIVTNVTDMFRGRYVNGGGDTEPNARSVMVESPTGSGKTVMAFMSIAMLRQEIPDLVVGWIAMRRDLLRQARRANAQMLDIPDIRFTSMFASDLSHLTQAKADGKPVLLCIDEAQHDAASSCAHIHNEVEPEMILGLTATPFRTDRMKLCFDKVVKDAGIHQLVQDGYLSQYHHYTIPHWTVKDVADHYCLDPERWGRSIFYFLRKDECIQLREELCQRGHFEAFQRARRENDRKGIAALDPVVDGDSHREEQLDAYLNGDTDKLINCMVLTEGFDDPSLQTVWVRDSSRGPTMQMAGRVFRQFPDLAFKQVVQSKDTKHPMIKTALPRMQFMWQANEWRSLTLNENMGAIHERARTAVAQAQSELPKWLRDRREKKRRRRQRF